ncbi:hypothetical protein TTRE_0000827701 [Trichuris trichiura]|uniref:Uncharacterized protein n=1 Tax=Trichuris trichiura TaxID=36087 RepID=A0A077ZMM0_TRITR|nr:hypothetical protein TTRE_0000827701 [Trichuris trichiura]
MSPAFIIITLISIDLASHVSTRDAYRCPSEAKMAIGFKRRSECVTWMLFEPIHGDVDVDVDSLLNSYCMATFLNGIPYGFINRDGFDISTLWIHSKVISKTWRHGRAISGHGHYFFRITSDPDCDWYVWRWSCSMQIDTYVEGEISEYRYSYWHLITGSFAGRDGGWLLAIYNPDDYLKWFLDRKWVWLCHICSLNRNGDFYPFALNECNELIRRTEHHVSCIHSP